MEEEYPGPQIADYEDASNYSLAEALKIEQQIAAGILDPFFELRLSNEPW